MKTDPRSALRTSDLESAKPEWAPVGERLASIRGFTPQPAMASKLGVSKTTYGRLERGVREVGSDVLRRLAELGWNPLWVLSGEGNQRLDAGAVRESPPKYGSQDVSEEALTIALELADEAVRGIGATFVPRSLYARLVRLLYQGVTQGLPVAQVHQIGQEAARAIEQGGTIDVGKQGVDRAGT